jgi:AcrR family transcriptional regulator
MPRPKSDIDARIVAAARARFLVEGVDGASLRSIAQDAGTNVGMIYYYFPTKDDLFLGVVEDVYARTASARSTTAWRRSATRNSTCCASSSAKRSCRPIA